MDDNNIIRAKIDEDSLSLLTTAFALYNISKSHNNILKNKNDAIICRNLIKQYYKRVNPNYVDMILNFKRRYIANEALVEKNDTPEERKGVALAYDYITNYDIEKEPFNIFVNALQIHSLLYKPLDDKNRADSEERRRKAQEMYEEAKRNKDLKMLREAREYAKTAGSSSFGGSLRTEPVSMQGFDVIIPSPKEACIMFNEFIAPDKVKEYEDALNNDDIFEYIRYCVKTTADLIAMQPFGDGNKRTFRTLLNLMFKKRNLPPVYIVKKERKAYHDALEKAVCSKDYEDLIDFYYFKICDSIYKLDFEPYLRYLEQENAKTNVKAI